MIHNWIMLRSDDSGYNKSLVPINLIDILLKIFLIVFIVSNRLKIIKKKKKNRSPPLVDHDNSLYRKTIRVIVFAIDVYTILHF